MIAPEEYGLRRERLRQRLGQEGLAGAVVVGRSFYDRVGDLAYLCGHYPPFPASVFSGSVRGVGHGFLILPTERDPVLVVDGFYRDDLVAIDDVRPSTNLVHGVASALEELGLHDRRLGLGGEDVLSLAFYKELSVRCPRVELSSIDPVLRGLRRVKSPAEQRLLASAAKVAEAGLAAALEVLRPGASERQIAAAGIEAAVGVGADFVRYFRVHSGPWSAVASRWPPATDRRIEPGEVVFLDVIGAAMGYQFDVLRTTVAGSPSSDDRRMLDAVARSIAEVLAFVRPGRTAGDVAKEARRVLADEGFGEEAGRFVGHAIGLETVEEPYLLADDETVLEPGMAFCVEPAVWREGRNGCSIEQEILLGEDSVELWTTSPFVLW